MAAREYLGGIADRLAARGRHIHIRTALGSAAAAIVTTAQAEKADLIAMTTHGRGGIRRLVFGSVAEEVLRTAPVPVLLFRDRAEPEARPQEGQTP